ncbi:MAG: PqqD family protein [Caldilineae bacterium]|nr:PqqD family protein [Anaerolineae bacterium]MCB0203186.1 PqqD family protein [Anaerolineae bacterium]MCB0254027.1 PqqD family protein [Anaerolineae bacterium]MCB9154140.1 PqqD family protein [Caldilineae bacterium]
MSNIDIRRPIHHPSTASRVFGSDAVVISPTENMVRMLNPVGSRIWQLTDGSNTIEDIAVTLTQEFEVDLPHARQSVAGFVEDLVDRNLLDWSES